MRVPYDDGAWPAATGFLYGYVSTKVAGHRAVSVAGSPYLLTAGYYRGDALLAQCNADLPVTGAVGVGGQVLIVQAFTTLDADDMLLWALGYGCEPGDHRASSLFWYAPFVSPVMIPHSGATWEAVDLSRDVDLSSDGILKGLGNVWGAARVWRWTIKLTPWAFAAFRLGRCMSGQVALEGAVSSAMGAAEPGGALTGRVLGVEGVDWSDERTLSLATVRLIVATEGS